MLLGMLLALAACDRSAETQADAAAARPALRPTPAQVERGRLVYAKHCLQCHGPEGRGQPGDWRVKRANGMYPPPPLDDSAHAWHHPTAELKKRIREGSPPDVGDMPAWQGRLSETEIDDVVAYIKSLWSPKVWAHWTEIEARSLQQ